MTAASLRATTCEGERKCAKEIVAIFNRLYGGWFTENVLLKISCDFPNTKFSLRLSERATIAIATPPSLFHRRVSRQRKLAAPTCC